MYTSENGHVESVRVLIEKGALIEAANKVRIHSHATTRARSQTLIHTRMHTLACERTILSRIMQRSAITAVQRRLV